MTVLSMIISHAILLFFAGLDTGGELIHKADTRFALKKGNNELFDL